MCTGFTLPFKGDYLLTTTLPPLSEIPCVILWIRAAEAVKIFGGAFSFKINIYYGDTPPSMPPSNSSSVR